MRNRGKTPTGWTAAALFAGALVVAAALLVSGCSVTGTGTGTITLNLSDAPTDADNVTGVWITITGVQYNSHTVGDGEESDSEQWVDFEDFEPGTYNLLELTGGTSALLGQLTLPAGTYNQIRFLLDAPEEGGSVPENPGCYITFTDGTTETTEPLFVPSGGQTGYKAVSKGPFDVPANGTVSITADFDVRKSVVTTAAASRYILKPVIRLVVDDEAGRIKLTVDNDANYTGLIAYVYESDFSWSETEAQEGEETPAFANAVTSATQNEEGAFLLPYLESGTYYIALQYTVTDGTTTTTGVGFVDGPVTVTAGDTTSLAAATSALAAAPPTGQ